MVIGLIGQPFWCNRIAAALNRHLPTGSRAISFNPRQLMAGTDVLDVTHWVRVGFRPGAPTIRGRSFDILWRVLRFTRPSSQFLHYWIGTDVLNTLNDYTRARLTRGFRFVQAETHLAAAPTLVEELASIGISSIYVPPPLQAIKPPEERLQLPERFHVLTYIPDFRAEFYGGSQIVHAARALPEIRFTVIGGNGQWLMDKPSNLHFAGWVSDATPYHTASSLLVRMTLHDGLPAMIREALQLGRHVIFSHSMPHTENVSFTDSDRLVARISKYRLLHETGELTINRDGREWAMNEFDEHSVVFRFLSGISQNHTTGSIDQA